MEDVDLGVTYSNDLNQLGSEHVVPMKKCKVKI